MEIERSHFRDSSKDPTHLMPSPYLWNYTGHKNGTFRR